MNMAKSLRLIHLKDVKSSPANIYVSQLIACDDSEGK